MKPEITFEEFCEKTFSKEFLELAEQRYSEMKYEKENQFKMLEYYVSALSKERLEELAMDLLCEKFGIPVKTRNADLIRLWESIGG